MELFERIKQIAGLAGSETKLASRLNLPQTTFNGYLKPSRQDNLWPLLPKILELFPQVNREWLYFGEGEMTGETSPRVAVPPMTTAVRPMKAAMSAAGDPVEGDAALAAAGELTTLRQKLLASYELNARLTDANTRLTDEVLRLNDERRRLMERLEWEKISDKTALSPLTARGGTSEEH